MSLIISVSVDHMDLTEIDLGIAWSPRQFSKPVSWTLTGLMPLFHVRTHCSIRTLITLLGDKTLENPFRGMALFARTATILLKNLINELHHWFRHHPPGPTHFHRDHRGKIVDRYILSDRVTRNTELARNLATRDSLPV